MKSKKGGKGLIISLIVIGILALFFILFLVWTGYNSYVSNKYIESSIKLTDAIAEDYVKYLKCLEDFCMLSNGTLDLLCEQECFNVRDNEAAIPAEVIQEFNNSYNAFKGRFISHKTIEKTNNLIADYQITHISKINEFSNSELKRNLEFYSKNYDIGAINYDINRKRNFTSSDD